MSDKELASMVTGGKFFSKEELSSMFGVCTRGGTTKLGKLGRKFNLQPQLRTKTENGSITAKYRLANKPYAGEFECCDPRMQSKIEWADIAHNSGQMSDGLYEFLCGLYELRDDYHTNAEIGELLKRSKASVSIEHLEHHGFKFHRRGTQKKREVKLIGFKRKQSKENQAVEVKKENDNLKLINEVFR